MAERPDNLQLPLFGQGPARRGQTERNLAEYPVTLIADRAPKGAQLREYRWESKDRNGRMVRRSWTIAASAGQTLPLATDRDVYIVLMQMTLEQGNEQPVVTFSRNELVTRLGWAHTGGNFRRLKESLARLANVTITAENLFVDAFGDTVPLQVFNIISDLSLRDERRSGRERRSYIRWSDTMAEQIRTGVLASIDVGFYLSLSSGSLCRRLFEYLNKKRYVRLDRDGTPRYRRNFPIRVMHLAQAHLFLAADRPSEVKRKLEPAHQELIDRGFLSGVKWVETRKGEPMVIYEYAAGAMTATQPEPAPLPSRASVEISPAEAQRRAQVDAELRRREDLDAYIAEHPELMEDAAALVERRTNPAPKQGGKVWTQLTLEAARELAAKAIGQEAV